MTRALWMIQLYNVSATNRPNLLGNSTPQKTITVVEASLKVVIMLPFWVLALASQLRQEKWRNISHFLASSLSIQSLGMWAAVKMRKTRNKRRVKLARFGGRKNRNRKNYKGFVNYALWNGKFSETKWSKGWERGERRSKSFPLWIVWEHNLITEAEFQHQTYSYLDTVLIAIVPPPTTRGLCWITLVCKSCSFLVGRWVVIRLSAARAASHRWDQGDWYLLLDHFYPRGVSEECNNPNCIGQVCCSSAVRLLSEFNLDTFSEFKLLFYSGPVWSTRVIFFWNRIFNVKNNIGLRLSD